MLKKIAPWAGFLLYKLLYFTWRIEIHESDDLKRARKTGSPVVYAHWHGDELAILYLLKPYKVCAMISTSSDGQIMDRVVRLLGARTSRGSSTRGGVSALRGILRLAKEGWSPSVAVDGPKGPYHKVKPGVFEIAKLTNGEVIPLTVACTKAWVFAKAWNKTYLPRPFARLVVVFGPALAKLSREDDAHDLALASRLEIALSDAEQQARHLLAGS
ncbi:MAG: lysophospholipid acyltransferase family protein [Bdellovibrionales bacterium]|jgi:lysophospholipid acyltransferase (LPLAT)-like uncharacterized protein|nr:lysophospholipid acyltransferase family protein [Bdellovibrionales bacterium]